MAVDARELSDKVYVVCDITAEGELLSRLSTFQYCATTSVDGAKQPAELLVSKASVLINDMGGHPYMLETPA